MEKNWDLTTLYQSDDVWLQDFENFQKKIHKGSEELQKCDFSKNLLQGIELYLSLNRELHKLYTYAHLKFDEDLSQETYKEMYGKMQLLANDFQNKFCFFEPRILQLPEDEYIKILQDEKMKEYRFYLEAIYRVKPHTLDEEKEMLLALSGPALLGASKAFSSLNNADMQFKDAEAGNQTKHPVSHGLYGNYLRKTDRVLRKNAFESIHSEFLEHKNTLCELLSSQVNKHIFHARARKYPTALDAALYENNIDTKVYLNLIKTVDKNLSTLHNYISYRKNILGIDKVFAYDLYAPLAESSSKQFSYDEAVDLIIASVKPLGEEYQTILKKGLTEQNWVSPFEKKGKRSGAYSSGCYDSYPYILMNYQKTLNDVFTLAHEAGHSMHSFLSRKNQPYQYSQYTIFLAEIASTYNELLLLDYLRKTFKNDQQIQTDLLLHEMSFLRATLFRQTQFAEFELMIHQTLEQQQPLTPEYLNEQYKQLNEKYYGRDFVCDKFTSVEWARIPHFYYNFYVYQYATGISCAYYFFKKTKNNHEEVQQYLHFLGLGGSKYSLDILKDCGVDLCSEHVIQSALDRFTYLTDKLGDLCLST